MAAVWKTVRVFISSTFRDMRSERDHLVRIVFPELRERCANRHLHLVDVDLRWGVTEEDAQQGKALEICLREIEDCRPFFIGLLGERYGWIPFRYDIPDDEPFQSLREIEAGHSITAMEIYHGVLNNPEMRKHAFFYFRDPAFINALPPERQPDFRAEDDEHADKLRRLKDRIRATDFPVRENYRFDDLDAFGRQVLEDLWTAIQAEHPERIREFDPLDAELAYHDYFIETRSELFVGQRHLLVRLHRYVASNDSGPMVVTGTPGCGKSALLAKFIKEHRLSHPEQYCLYHFTGVSPTSTDPRQLLHRMCQELYRGVLQSQKDDRIRKKSEEIGLQESEQATKKHRIQMETARIEAEYVVPSEESRLRERFKEFLNKASLEGRCLIVIDALNQLEESFGPEPFGWLPAHLPPGMRLVVSSTVGPTLDSIQRQCATRQEMIVTSLRLVDQGFIVARLLKMVHKRLTTARKYYRANAELSDNDAPAVPGEDRSQLRFILTGVYSRRRQPSPDQVIERDTANPLYLRLIVEELRIYGDFETLPQFIANLPTDVPGMFDAVLRRLEHDHGRELVAHSLSLIALGRHGLLEDELLELLSDDGESRFPMALWSRLYRGLSFYLKPRASFAGGAEGLIDYFHRQLAKVVYERYLADDNSRQARCHELMSYFRTKADPQQNFTWTGTARGLSELPYHQGAAGCWDDYEKCLTDLAFLDAKCQNVMASGLLRDYDVVLASTPSTHSPSSEFTEFAEFVREEFENLSRFPLITYQQAANRTASSAIANATARQLPSGLHRRPWLRWLNKPMKVDPCVLRFAAPSKVVNACEFMPGGQQVLAALSSGSLLVWNLRSGQKRFLEDRRIGSPSACTCTPDGRHIVSGDDRGRLHLWDVESGRLLQFISAHSAPIRACACSPDGKLVATGSDDGELKVWLTETLQLSMELEVGPIRICHFSPDSRSIVVATEGEDYDLFSQLFEKVFSASQQQRDSILRPTFQLWQLATRACVARHSVPQLSACCFSPDGTRVLTVGSGGLSIWDGETGALLEEHPEHKAKRAGLSGDASCIALVRQEDGWLSSRYQFIELRDSLTLTPIGVLSDLTSTPDICVPSPNAEQLLTVNGNMLRIWDTRRLEHVSTHSHQNSVTCCAWAPDGSEVVSASKSGELKAWSAPDARISATQIENSKLTVERCVFSPDGSRIFAVEDDFVRVWNARTRLIVAHIALNVADIRVSPDSRAVASITSTRDLAFPATSRTQIWDAKTFEAIACGAEENGRSVACCFSPDGHWFASASNDQLPDGRTESWLSVQNARTGESSKTIRMPEPIVSGCDWCISGKNLVVASAGKLFVWDTGTWKIVRSSMDCPYGLTTCRFSPDCRHVFTIVDDSALGVWDSQTGDLVAVFPGKSPVSCYALGRRIDELAAGDVGGDLYRLEPVGLPTCFPHVTVGRIYDFSNDRWEPTPGFSCPGCGQRTSVSTPIRQAIEEAVRRAESAAAGTSCFPRSTESVAADSRLQGECSKCGLLLRFNPFLVDGEERYSKDPSTRGMPVDASWTESTDAVRPSTTNHHEARRKITCPNCWYLFSPSDANFVARHEELRGDSVLGLSEPQRFQPKTYTPHGDAIDAKGVVCPDAACPRCHYCLPRSLFAGQLLFVPILGTEGSGRRRYLSRLMEVLPHALTNVLQMPSREREGQRLRRVVEIRDQIVNTQLPRMLNIPKGGREFEATLALVDSIGETYSFGRDSLQVGLEALQDAVAFIAMYDPTAAGSRQQEVIGITAHLLARNRSAPLTFRDARPMVVAVAKCDLLREQFNLETDPCILRSGPRANSLDLTRMEEISGKTRRFLMNHDLSFVCAVEASFRDTAYFPVSSIESVNPSYALAPILQILSLLDYLPGQEVGHGP